MDTTTIPVGYMYEFDCKPVAKVNYPTNGWNVIMNDHQFAFVEKSSSVLTQVCQGNIPAEDNVTAIPGQSNNSSITPIVSETTMETTTVPSTTARKTTQLPPETTIITTAMSSATTVRTIITPGTNTAAKTFTSTATALEKSTTAFMTMITENVNSSLPLSSYSALRSTTNLPTTTSTTTKTTSSTSSPTSRKTTPKVLLSLVQVPDQSNLNLCPTALTKATDGRWIRQYKNFCYEIVSGRYKDWYAALQDCNDRHGDNIGGTLLEIYTAEIQHFIEQFLKNETFSHPVWIGLQDVDKEESFDHWETGTVLQYQNFDPNRKDNYAPHGKEDCVLLEPSGLWDDSICDEDDAISLAHGGHQLAYRHSYICQYPTTTTQTTTTTTQPATINSMLSNMTGNVQLCPRVVRDSTDVGFLRQYNRYCYELVSKYGDWYEANQYCRDRGTGLNGLLIEIYTADIQHFIAKTLADEGYTHPVWIGLQDVDKEESFDHWESDTPLAYANFDPNRKDNYANHAQENCVLLEPSGYWDDSVCDVREANQAARDGHPGLVYNHHWICQYPIQYQNIIGK